MLNTPDSKSPNPWGLYTVLTPLTCYCRTTQVGTLSLFSGETSGNESDAEYLPKSEWVNGAAPFLVMITVMGGVAPSSVIEHVFPTLNCILQVISSLEGPGEIWGTKQYAVRCLTVLKIAQVGMRRTFQHGSGSRDGLFFGERRGDMFRHMCSSFPAAKTQFVNHPPRQRHTITYLIFPSHSRVL